MTPIAGDRDTISACTHKIAIGDSDLINVGFGPLCGLKSDISRGPRSARIGLMYCNKRGGLVRGNSGAFDKPVLPAYGLRMLWARPWLDGEIAFPSKTA